MNYCTLQLFSVKMMSEDCSDLIKTINVYTTSLCLIGHDHSRGFFFKVPPKEMIDLCLNTVEVSSKKDLTVKSQFPAVRQSILYDGKKVLLLA